MAISKSKVRLAITLDKKAVEIIEIIRNASNHQLTKSDVIQICLAEYYLSVLDSVEQKGEKA